MVCIGNKASDSIWHIACILEIDKSMQRETLLISIYNEVCKKDSFALVGSISKSNRINIKHPSS